MFLKSVTNMLSDSITVKIINTGLTKLYIRCNWNICLTYTVTFIPFLAEYFRK